MSNYYRTEQHQPHFPWWIFIVLAVAVLIAGCSSSDSIYEGCYDETHKEYSPC